MRRRTRRPIWGVEVDSVVRVYRLPEETLEEYPEVSAVPDPGRAEVHVVLSTTSAFLRTAPDAREARNLTYALPFGGSVRMDMLTGAGAVLVGALPSPELREVVRLRPATVDLPVVAVWRLWRRLRPDVDLPVALVYAGERGGGCLIVAGREVRAARELPPVGRLDEEALRAVLWDSGTRPEAVFVAGPGAERVREAVSRALSVDVRAFPGVDPVAAPAVGAALRGTQTDAWGLNLLEVLRGVPAARGAREGRGEDRRPALRAFGWVGTAAGALLAAGLWLWTVVGTELEARRLRAARAELEALRPYEEMLQTLRRREAELRQTVDAIRELSARRVRAGAVLMAVARAIPDDVWLERMEFDGGRLRLEGRTRSEKSLSAFAEALARPPLGDVRIEVYEARAAGEPARFVLSAGLRD